MRFDFDNPRSQKTVNNWFDKLDAALQQQLQILHYLSYNTGRITPVTKP